MGNLCAAICVSYQCKNEPCLVVIVFLAISILLVQNLFLFCLYLNHPSF